MSKTLYGQAEDYVRSSETQQEELRENDKLARVYYKEGRVEEARQLWQKVAQDAKLKPLIFKF